jgi:hypothetical protein
LVARHVLLLHDNVVGLTGREGCVIGNLQSPLPGGRIEDQATVCGVSAVIDRHGQAVAAFTAPAAINEWRSVRERMRINRRWGTWRSGINKNGQSTGSYALPVVNVNASGGEQLLPVVEGRAGIGPSVVSHRHLAFRLAAQIDPHLHRIAADRAGQRGRGVVGEAVAVAPSRVVSESQNLGHRDGAIDNHGDLAGELLLEFVVEVLLEKGVEVQRMQRVDHAGLHLSQHGTADLLVNLADHIGEGVDALRIQPHGFQDALHYILVA